MTRDKLIEAMALARATFVSEQTLQNFPGHLTFLEEHVPSMAAAFNAIEASGYVVVPLNPNEHMLDVGACHEDQDHVIFDEGTIAGDVYRAMIEAGKV